MRSIIKIALRNLIRYKRRTLLTASLITTGIVFVIVYIAVSGSFKGMMIGQITDSMLGHAQIHRTGYVDSIENLPLNMTLKTDEYKSIESILKKSKEIEAYSPRIKFGAMFSNYVETTNIRLTGVYPEKEYKTVPLLSKRIISGSDSLKKGEILIPQLLADGMKIRAGDNIVIVATNRDGSVNGMQFTVSGVLSSVVGPGGRDGYMHFEDTVELLRMDNPEISEIAIRVNNFNNLMDISKNLKKRVLNISGSGKPAYEYHTWEGLSPFSSIVKMIDVMTFFIRIMLIAIVLISIMNVMIMAVYERIREIGTIGAIGTLPEKILYMYLAEGFLLGTVGSLAGIILSIVIIFLINISGISFTFGKQQGLILHASISVQGMIVIIISVLFVSLIAGFYPAYKASKMEPVDALRHV